MGDLIPLRVKLIESEKPILEVNEILMEKACLRVPLTELFAQYKVSPFELLRETKTRARRYKKDPVILKIEAMASDPRFSDRLKPSRTQFSLRKGELKCKVEGREILIPVVLEQSGLHSFKVEIQCETPDNGPIYRTDMVTVNVGPGKANPKLTRATFIEISTEKLKGALIHITPRNERGQLMGPGLAREFKAMVLKEELKIKVKDQLDRSYQVELPIPEKLRKIMKEKSLPLRISFRGKTVWNKGI